MTLALWAIRAGANPPDSAPMWIRLGTERARRVLSAAIDVLGAEAFGDGRRHAPAVLGEHRHHGARLDKRQVRP